MKKYISIFVAIGLVLSLAAIALAYTPGEGIRATPHDLSLRGAIPQANMYQDDNNLDRICIYCHAPHNSAPTDGSDLVLGADFDYLPLWNHAGTNQISSGGGYQMYSNGTNAALWEPHQFNGLTTAPGGVSLLCLSCHDGTVAVSEYGQYNGANGPSSKGSAAGLHMQGNNGALIGGNGGNLTNHHPIGFNYDDVALADPEIRDSSVGLPVDTGTNGGIKVGGPTFIYELLYNGNMECVTCHDVHNTKNGGHKFTWVEDYNSNFCLTCHVKDETDNMTTFTPNDLPVGFVYP